MKISMYLSVCVLLPLNRPFILRLMFSTMQDGNGAMMTMNLVYYFFLLSP